MLPLAGRSVLRGLSRKLVHLQSWPWPWREGAAPLSLWLSSVLPGSGGGPFPHLTGPRGALWSWLLSVSPFPYTLSKRLRTTPPLYCCCMSYHNLSSLRKSQKPVSLGLSLGGNQGSAGPLSLQRQELRLHPLPLQSVSRSTHLLFCLGQNSLLLSRKDICAWI